MYIQANNSHEDIKVEGTLVILADDGRDLFSLDLDEDGSLHIHTGARAKHNDVMLDGRISITAKSSNWFTLRRMI